MRSNLEKEIVLNTIRNGKIFFDVNENSYRIKNRVPDFWFYLTNLEYEKTMKIRLVIEAIDSINDKLKELEETKSLLERVEKIGFNIVVKKSEKDKVSIYENEIMVPEKLYSEDWREVIDKLTKWLNEQKQKYIELAEKLVENGLYVIEKIEEQDEYDC